MTVTKNTIFPFQILASKYILKRLTGVAGDQIPFKILKISQERKQIVVHLPVSNVSDRFKLVAWTKNGTIKLDLEIEKTLTNMSDHVMSIRDIKLSDSNSTSAADGVARCIAINPKVATDEQPTELKVGLPITHLSDEFLALKVTDKNSIDDYKSAINAAEKVQCYNGRKAGKFEVTKTGNAEVVNDHIIIKINSKSYELIKNELTYITKTDISTEAQELIKKGVI